MKVLFFYLIVNGILINNDIQDLKDNDFDKIKLEILKNMGFIEDLKNGWGKEEKGIWHK